MYPLFISRNASKPIGVEIKGSKNSLTGPASSKANPIIKLVAFFLTLITILQQKRF